LNLLLGLSDLPYRPVGNRDHQNDSRNNGTQNARYFFRFHLDIPVVPYKLISRKLAKFAWCIYPVQRNLITLCWDTRAKFLADASGLHRNRIRDFGPDSRLGNPEQHPSGTASSRGWTCNIDDNPIGFCLIVSGKAVVVGLAIAEILHAFGFVGDPIAHIKHARPFLA